MTANTIPESKFGASTTEQQYQQEIAVLKRKLAESQRIRLQLGSILNNLLNEEGSVIEKNKASATRQFKPLRNQQTWKVHKKISV